MKKTLLISLVSVFVVGLVGLIGAAGAMPPTSNPSHQGQEKFIPGQILVKFIPGTSENVIAKVHQQHSASIIDRIPGIDAQIVKVPAGQELEAIARYRKNPNVRYVEPDFVAQALLTPNDTYFSDQWGMSKVEAPLAWDVATASAMTKIAILDTGIDANHGDIKPKVVNEKNFTTRFRANDRNGHGTHVAGIAAAVTNNSKGVAGLGFNAALMNVKVLGDNGRGSYSWVANGIIWSADNGAKVINMSLGGSSASQTLEEAINYAWSKGVVLVAAAGNDNTSAPLYPAFYQNVIAAAATDQNDVKASFSNFGDWVDVAAPGVDIISTYPRKGWKDRYARMSGTSMSSPHVAGLAALVWETVYGADNLSVRNRIESTVDPLTDISIGKGRINAARAVGAK